MESISHLVEPYPLGKNMLSLYELIENILCIIKGARKNKAYAYKFTGIMKQIIKSVNGIEYTFIQQAEFYGDLKETLSKIQHHLDESTNRGKIVRVMMARKDVLSLDEIRFHVDSLCGRIFLAFSQRMKQRLATSQEVISSRKPKISFDESVQIKNI